MLPCQGQCPDFHPGCHKTCARWRQYLARQQQEREKPARCDLRHIVHENAYRPMGGAELEEMLAHQAGERPYADWLRAFCQRKYNSGFSREMTRSAAVYLEQFRDRSQNPLE